MCIMQAHVLCREKEGNFLVLAVYAWRPSTAGAQMLCSSGHMSRWYLGQLSLVAVASRLFH